MSNISNLVSAWSNAISNVASELIKAKAYVSLDDYEAMITAKQALSAKTLQSYSIAGRTFTFKTTDKLQIEIDRKETELTRLVYGSNYKTSVIMNPDHI